MKQLTAKQKVLLVFPAAGAKVWADEDSVYWLIHGDSRNCMDSEVLGQGATRNEAWADAARRLEKRK